MSTQRIDNLSNEQNQASATTRIGDSVVSSEISDNATTREGDGLHIVSSDIASFMANDVVQLNGVNYTIEKHIVSSGESEIFLVKNADKRYIFKYYFSQYKPHQEVLEKLRTIKRIDVLVPLVYGFHSENNSNFKRFFEISDFMTGGTLDSIKPIKSPEKLKIILQQVLEAIHFCHENGIVHRDIKPANIFFRNESQSQIALGDFGIASAVKDDYKLTKANKTNTYAAPEMFLSYESSTVVSRAVDYYALGISMLELWLGHDPFKGISEFAMIQNKLNQNIAMPTDMPKDWQTLIKGFLTFEETKRWNYTQVKAWLRGEQVELYYKSDSESLKLSPFEFDNTHRATTTKELAALMETNPRQGKSILYRNKIAHWVENASQGLFCSLMDLVEKEYPADKIANEEYGLIKAIYLLDKDRPYLAFDGQMLSSYVEIAYHIENNFVIYQEQLRKTHHSLYLFLEARLEEEKVKIYQRYYQEYSTQRATNKIILDLQDNLLLIANYVFHQPHELTKTTDDIQQVIASELRSIDSKVSIWLENYPELANSIETWRKINNQSLETLAYALNTGGFKIGTKEAIDLPSFIDLFKSEFKAFIYGNEAMSLRQKANEWLFNFKKSSLAFCVIEYINKEPSNFGELVVLCNYLLNEHQETRYNPFESIALISTHLKTKPLNEKIVEMAQEAAQKAYKQLNNNKKKNLEAIIKVFELLAPLQQVYPEMATAIAQGLDIEVSEGIKTDVLQIPATEKQALADYNLRLNFWMKEVGSKYQSLGFYKRALKEKLFFDKKMVKFKETQEKQKTIEITKIDDSFNKNLKDRKKQELNKFELKLNYDQKGKTFRWIFVAIAILMILIYIGFFSQMTYVNWLLSHKLLTLGIVFYAIVPIDRWFHTQFAKWSLKPIVNLRKKEITQEIQFSDSDFVDMNNKIKQIEAQFFNNEAIKRAEEQRNVVLWSDAELEKQLSKL